MHRSARKLNRSLKLAAKLNSPSAHEVHLAVADNLAPAGNLARRKTNLAAPKTKSKSFDLLFVFGADYGARTRHLDLGKVALYQMS